MKAEVEVSDRKEANLIREGLKDKKVRALVKVIGALSKLPTDRSRIRLLNFVNDALEERRRDGDPQ